MPVAKLPAGEGDSDYVRVIATHDADERGRQPLTDYCSEFGESPGFRLASGLGLSAGGR